MKYKYLYVIQGNYGQGWEYQTEVNKHWDKELCGPRYAPKTMAIRATEGYPKVNGKPYTPLRYAKYLLSEYKIAHPSYPHRIINRRVLDEKKT